MKILISISNLTFGGAQTFVVRLATGLSERHSVYIYTLDPNTEKTLVEWPSIVKVISLPSFINSLVWRLDKLLLKFSCPVKLQESLRRLHFKNILNRFKIDIVNSHLYNSDNFVVDVLEEARVPVVITDHGDYRYVFEHNYSTLDNILKIFSKANGIVYISESNATSLSQYTGNSKAVIKKIYNGVSLPVRQNYSISGRQKLGIPKDAFIFGMVARGIPEKGWAEAVQAFVSIKYLTGKNIHLIFVGDSDYLTSLRKSLDTKLSSSIHFVGYSSEPNYWIECFDVGLLPTYFAGESLPNSIIEYLSFDKPVITTEAGGIREMITHNGQIAGFIISLNQDGRSDVSSIADAMLRYVNDPILLKQHSNFAKHAFEKFKIEICIDSYESLFLHILNQESTH